MEVDIRSEPISSEQIECLYDEIEQAVLARNKWNLALFVPCLIAGFVGQLFADRDLFYVFALGTLTLCIVNMLYLYRTDQKRDGAFHGLERADDADLREIEKWRKDEVINTFRAKLEKQGRIAINAEVDSMRKHYALMHGQAKTEG